MRNKINLEIQYFDGCPNSGKLIERIKKVLEEEGITNFNYKETLIDSYEKATEIKFRGSPTLLINGEDFDDNEVPDNPGLNCRYYPNGLPGVDEIKKKLEHLV